MDLNDLEHTEKTEIENLFSNLTLLTKYLFGYKVSIYKCNFWEDCSCASNLDSSIHMMIKEPGIIIEEYKECYSADFIENLDFEELKREYNLIPRFFFIFFHELSHLLTIEMSGEEYTEKYYQWEKSNAYILDSDKIHRSFPYEKLADNLSMAIISKNKKDIFDIISGKNKKKSEKIIKENLELVRQYKALYIN